MTERFYQNRDFGDENPEKDDNFNPEMEGNIYNFPIIPDNWEVPSSRPIAGNEDCGDVEDEEDKEAILMNRLDGYVREYERFRRMAYSSEKFIMSQNMQPDQIYFLDYHSFNNPLNETLQFELKYDFPMILHTMANTRRNDIVEQWGLMGQDIVTDIDGEIHDERN